METKIFDKACIQFRLDAGQLKDLSASLSEVLMRFGVESEALKAEPHVSIAYCQSCEPFDAIRDVVREIEAVGETAVRSERFTVLSGLTTPFDYLAIELEPHEGLCRARRIADERMSTRDFRRGFKDHVSILMFKKGVMGAGQKVRLVRELNASLKIAQVLGRVPVWQIESIEVSSAQREIFYTRRIAAA